MREYDYQSAVNYIEEIPMFGPAVVTNTTDGMATRHKSGNENLAYILEMLGNPHKREKAIHIAGTNGKGSTSRFIANLLIASGFRVGVFTSPHLVKINERISIGDLAPGEKPGELGIHIWDISDADFADAFSVVKSAVDDAMAEGHLHLSYFEFLFAMATVYFAKQNLDYVIYETGLGGRLDATNLVMPVMTAITSIGLDHMKFLGNTIREIAFEKAGIIKEGIPVIYNTGEEEADLVVEAQAKLLSTKAVNVKKMGYVINDFTDKTIDFSIDNRYYKYHNMKLDVNGALYQADNACQAVVLVNELFSREQRALLEQDTIEKAFAAFYWPGRMEHIFQNVIFDGAHNVDAIQRFVESIQTVYTNRGIRLLFAVAGDKEYEPMIQILCDKLCFEEVYVTSIASNRKISADYIAALFKLYGAKKRNGEQAKVFYDEDMKTMFSQAYYAVRDTDDMLFCLGSLYLIGGLKQVSLEVVT